MNFRLSIIILNYRTPQLVIDCLTSLQGELDPSQDIAVVVDNASGDGSAEQIEAKISENGWGNWVKLVRSPVNGGFGAGNNAGILSTPASLYWLTNSDTIFRKGSVATMLAAVGKFENAGILSPRLEWLDGDPQISCFRFHHPVSELLDAAKTGPITRVLQKYEVPIPVSDQPSHPDWTSFASVLIRHEVIKQIGLMDDGYFMYFDDVDYCRRTSAAGWDIVHCPKARVVHLRGQSSDVKKATASRGKRPAYYYESRSHYYQKFFGKMGLISANLLWELGRGVAWVRENAGNKQPHVCQDEWRDIWIGT